ncbi:MAG: CsgG/HfaB family protein [Chitinispirillales bacterium]|jgi:hypothetical protein|nr:CsgG/HfaB family protein [Chitinispirillales bacterium]
MSPKTAKPRLAPVRVYKYGRALLYIALALVAVPSTVLAQGGVDSPEAVAAPDSANSAVEPEARAVPTVAVYVTGEAPDYLKDYFGTCLLTALVNGGAYYANDANSDALITAIRVEQSQRNYPIDDGRICELGGQYGIRYICAASITPTALGTFTLSARIISAKTGRARFYGETASRIVTMEDLEAASGAVVEKMFAKETQPAPKAEPSPYNTAATAQEPEPNPAIAVYVTGGDNIPKTTKDAMNSFLIDALVNSGNYRAIERSETFLAEIDREQTKQRDGSVDDAQISQIGKQAGVRFVCVANITPALGAYQVSARVIDVETADVAASGVSSSPLETLNDLKIVSAAVVYKMLGVRMKTDENFELLTDNEKTALEQSIQETVQQTMRTKQPYRKSFWLALSCDIAGAGIFGIGLYEEISVGNNIDKKQYSKAQSAETARNVCYVLGALVLASGISIHILF